jgi:Na+-driven multidrug efflux pump
MRKGIACLWVAAGLLAVSIVFLCLLLTPLPGSGIWAAIGLGLILAALILVTVGLVSILKADDKENQAEPKDEAPKAH